MLLEIRDPLLDSTLLKIPPSNAAEISPEATSIHAH